MIVYLDEIYERKLRQGSMSLEKDLYAAIIATGAQHVRSKMTLERRSNEAPSGSVSIEKCLDFCIVS